MTASLALLAEDVRRSCSAYRRALERRFGARLGAVTLFGSRARGDAEPDSDVDVAVVVDDLTETERGEAIDLARTARPPGTPLIAPLVWSRAQWQARLRAERRIALDILNEGIAL